MRVIVLGGAGGMARPAIEVAIGLVGVDEVVVADLDGGRAAAVAAAVGGPVGAVTVDITDGPALAALLESADVALNFVGPYYRFGSGVLTAAIETGCHYLDVCDDWEPTLELLDLGPAATAAGVTAVVGLGASPGISNLLAATAMARLDRVEEVITAWSLEGDADDVLGDADGDGGVAALEHWIHQLTDTIRVVEDGEPVDVRPLQRATFDYPGLGPLSGWTVGHPEPLTLGRRPDVQRSVNYMVQADDIVPLLRWLAGRVESGRITERRAAERIASLLKLIARLPGFVRRPLLAGRGSGQLVPALLAVAVGERRGRPVRVGVGTTALPPGGMAGLTGIPAAMGLELLVAGRLDRPGVWAPEDAIDPEAFFETLAPHCDPGPGDGRGMVAVTEAVDEPATGD